MVENAGCNSADYGLTIGYCASENESFLQHLLPATGQDHLP
jgi:hypothetical protein